MERQKRKQKSRAKMAGVKSTFVIGRDLLMTSFGERDEAVREKYIAQGNVESLRKQEQAFDARYSKEKIFVTNADNKLHVAINNPCCENKKQSPEAQEYSRRVLEHKKAINQKYETIVFGKPSNDNIHIQVVSKILDIEKTFSFVMGNIVYAINNLDPEQDVDNPIDYMSHNARTDENLKRVLRRCMYLFDLGFEYDQPSSNKKSKQQIEQEREVREKKNLETLKKALDVISVMRTDSFHGYDSCNSTSAIVKLPSKKFNLDQKGKNLIYRDALKNKIDTIKRQYAQNSKVNINFLCYVLYGNGCTEEQKKELSREYFNFAILKQYKNLGFSITSLREQLLSLYDMDFEDKSNLRSRANSFCDYVLYYRYAIQYPGDTDYLVGKLRCSANEKDKTNVYVEEANWIKEDLRIAFERINNFDVASIAEYSTTNYVDVQPTFPFEQVSQSIKGGEAARVKADAFCDMAYYLTQFLDGKEINVFLTTLHNLFENIASFLDVMHKQNIPYDFTEQYVMFYDSAYIVKKLETVISVSRMNKALDFYNGQALRDAIRVLGISERHVDMDMKEYVDKYLFDDCKDVKHADHNLRNFIVTNVIKSRKFNYLARYSDMATVSKLSKNKEVVKFVLKRVDPKQIERYYRSVCDVRNISAEDEIEKLVDIIYNFNIDELEQVNNAEIGTGHSGRKVASKRSVQERNQARACVSLYLNVLYQIVKNLMNVNSRYSIAFAMTERDMIVEGKGIEAIETSKDDKNGEKKSKKQIAYRTKYIALTEEYLDKGYMKCATERIRENIKKYGGDPKSIEHIPGEYIKKNLEGYCVGSTNTFRNAVAHLALMARVSEYASDIKNVNSYFSLYHYCMQKHILYCARRFNKQGNEKMAAALKDAEIHRSYSKDAVKFLCLPFAYNLPRYKALTVEGLFDWNEYGQDDK